ncbi:hypothetical protein GCM10010308_63290 [Streptomyces vinaceusdrappus]|nr:hypothetical protein GCM10010308_63290 [Streptomyces vinaceusdrappus]
MATVDNIAYRYRSAVPEDAEAIKALDGSFTTDTVFQVTVTDDGFALREIAVRTRTRTRTTGTTETPWTRVPSSPTGPPATWPGSSPPLPRHPLRG